MFGEPPSMHPFSVRDALEARKNNKVLEYSLLIPCNCNLKCKYCFTDHQKPKNSSRKQITLQNICSFIDAGIPYGLNEVQIVGSGEPTLYEHFWELADYVLDQLDTFTVFTNSLNNTPELSRQFAEKEINIVTKLNSTNPKTNDWLTGVPGSYNKLVKAVDNLLDAGYGHNGLKIGLHTVVCQQNYKDLHELWRFCRDKSIIPYFQTLVPPPNLNDIYYKQLQVSIEQSRKLFYDLLKIDENEYGYTWIPTPPVVAQGCQKSRYGLGINTFGDVSFCAYSNIVHGNLFEEPLDEILKKESVKQVRYVRELSKSKCGRCNHPTCQGGCRAIAHNTTKDILGPDTLCWWKE